MVRPRLDPTLEITIVHATDRFVVIDKPSGMLSVPGIGPEYRDCVAARVQQAFPDASGPLIAHRLDMETSGLLVLALDPDAHRNLSMQFQRREVAKRYMAVLGGSVRGDEGVVALALRPDPERRPHQLVDPVHGKPSHTRWHVLAREDDRTRVEFAPRTGRTHQLRLHAAYPREGGGLGCPILGDTLYGDPASAPRLLLHACELAFADPSTGGSLRFSSPVPF